MAQVGHHDGSLSLAKQSTWIDRMAWRLIGTNKAREALGVQDNYAWSIASAAKSVTGWVQAQRVTTISKYDRAQLYAASVMAYAAANYRAINMASVPMKVIDPNGKVISEPGTEDYQPDNMLVYMFRQGANYSRLMRRNEYAVCFYGWTLNHIGRNAAQIPNDLMWINPYGVTIDADNYRGLRGFYLGSSYETQDIGETYLEPHQVVFMNLMDFRDDFDGIAPAEAAFQYTEADAEIAQTYAATFRNMAIPALAVQATQDFHETFQQEDADALKRSLRQIAGGAINSGSTIVHPYRVEWERLQPVLKDLDLGTVGQQIRDSVALAFGLPIDLLMMNSANLAQAQEARRSWAENWLVPQATWYGQGYTEQVAEIFGEGWTIEPDFDNVPALRENTTEKQQVLSGKLLDGTITYGQYQTEAGDEVVEEIKNMIYVPALQAPVPVSEVPTLWEKLIPTLPGMGDLGLSAWAQSSIPAASDPNAQTEDGAIVADNNVARVQDGVEYDEYGTAIPQGDVMGYHVDSGAIEQDELRAQFHLPPKDDESETELATLRNKLEVARQARDAGLTELAALELVGLADQAINLEQPQDKPVKAVWVDDREYAELKTLLKALKKHGASYDFKSDIIGLNVINYVKASVLAGDDHDAIMASAREMVAKAAKAPPITEDVFFETVNLWDELGLNDLVRNEIDATDNATATD